MTQIAVLSDIHGNLEALQAVLTDCLRQQAGKIICLGDVIGYGPDPEPCLEKLFAFPQLVCLQGNHESMLLGETSTKHCSVLGAAAADWVQEKMSGSSWLPRVKGFPCFLEQTPFLFTHNGFVSDPQWQYLNSAESVRQALTKSRLPVTFYGHTHRARISSLSPEGELFDCLAPRQAVHVLDPALRYFVNVGSVGQARSTATVANYVLLREEDKTVIEFRTVRYNSLRTYQEMLIKGIPRQLTDYLIREKWRRVLYGSFSNGRLRLCRQQPDSGAGSTGA